MPRVRASAGNPHPHDSPVKTVSIPLNDDRSEKAARQQSRHAIYSAQKAQIQAAASPARKRKSLGPNRDGGDDGPQTPTQQSQAEAEAAYGVAGTAVTPMKRVPILANFEEWMKMATDNKINATNSWNFALIDYFHDMSLLKEGDSVNFQKASCTLDGCVKIYTSRVDSVATETGKLLSGLAESKEKKRKGEREEEGEDEDGEDGEDGEGTKKKSKKRSQRSAEATLATSFDQLKLKKMELEFSVDPLFKKASADFDEGGAKGLLLNHLSIDSSGRIVFDSSDDAQDEEHEEDRRDSMEPEGMEENGEKEAQEPAATEQDGPIDLAGLGARFFPSLDKLDNQDICPSLKTFELGSGSASLELPFLKAPENWRDEHPEADLNDAPAPNPDDDDHQPFAGDFDDDDGADMPFSMPAETGFGEGGEAWARDAALHTQQGRVHDVLAGASPDDDAGDIGTFDAAGGAAGNAYNVTLAAPSAADHENILSYFDAAHAKNWAGPEHWKITRVRDAASAKAPAQKAARKEKEPFEIDFGAEMTGALAAQLYTEAASNSVISLPRREWKSRGRNLLPDDKHFHSRDLLGLFLKPRARVGMRKGGRADAAGVDANGDLDEAYWAARQKEDGGAEAEEGEDVKGDYDADFFADDAMPFGGDMDAGAADDDDVFADAREAFSPPAGDDVEGAADAPVGPGIDGVVAAGGSQEAFGANLVAQSRRMRPEYVQYARVAKKVDVRRLKEEMWRGIGCEPSKKKGVEHDDPPTPTQLSQSPPSSLPLDDPDNPLKFTTIMNALEGVYPRGQLADISTSYGFICLLHLANEKGLVIENVDGWQDLTVRRDPEGVVVE